MVALSTSVRLHENCTIDKPTFGDIDDDVDHIISYGHLTSSAKPKIICYFDITLTSATLCHAGRYISRHRNSIDMMEFPFDVTSIIQYILMKKHHSHISTSCIKHNWIINFPDTSAQFYKRSYHQTSNISCTKFRNLKVVRFVLQMYLPNRLKHGVKLRIKM